MGNKAPGCVSASKIGSKSKKGTQLTPELCVQLCQGSDSFLGKGVLAPSHAVDNSLRCPLPLEGPRGLKLLRICKKIYQRSPYQPTPGQPLDERSDLEVSLAAHDGECRPLELLLEGSEESYPSLAAAVSAANTRPNFTLNLYIEIAAVGLRIGQEVEETVKTELSKGDVALFASNFGNAVIDRLFVGACLQLRFDQASETHTDPSASFMQSPNGRVYQFQAQQRGGKDPPWPRGKPLSVEGVDKCARAWATSIQGARPAGPGSDSPGVVRVKLISFSQVEGLIVPSALKHVDGERLDQWERARDGLQRAMRGKRLGELREALQQCREADLDDEVVNSSEAQLQRIEEAAKQLRLAKEAADSTRLEQALASAEQAGLGDWDNAELEAARTQLKSICNERHARALRAAALSQRTKDLAEALNNAHKEGYDGIEEFHEACRVLSDETQSLANKARQNTLVGGLERAQAHSELLESLPLQSPALAGVGISSGLFRKSVDTLRAVRSLEEDLRTALAAENVDRLRHLLAQADDLAVDMELKRKAQDLVDHRMRAHRMAEDVDKRLRDALESRSVEALEAALQDADEGNRKHLGRPPDASLVEAAQRALWAQLYAEFVKELNAQRWPAVKFLLKRMEICKLDAELKEASAAADRVKAESEAEQEREKQECEAMENLRRSLDSGDPSALDESLQRAKALGVGGNSLEVAAKRQQELASAQHALEVGLASNDFLALSTALEGANRAQLRTKEVREAAARLQGEKTNALVAAVRTRDHDALKQALSEADSRLSPAEQAQFEGLLGQARRMKDEQNEALQALEEARNVLQYNSLRHAVADVKAKGISSEHPDVRRAESALQQMESALDKLQRAGSSQNPAELKDALQNARRQGLQAEGPYHQALESYARICGGGELKWSSEELKELWVGLCLQSGNQGASQQPFNAAVSAICRHACLLEAEPHSLAYTQLVLTHVVLGEATLSIEDILQSALQELAEAHRDDAISTPESISANQFNLVGMSSRRAELILQQFIWWIHAVVEADSEQKRLEAFLRDLTARWAELTSECDIVLRALKTQAAQQEASGQPNIAPRTQSRQKKENSGLSTPPQPNMGAMNLRYSEDGLKSSMAAGNSEALRPILEQIEHLRGEASRQLNACGERHKSSQEAPLDLGALRTQARKEKFTPGVVVPRPGARQREASTRLKGMLSGQYAALETKLLQLQQDGRRVLDGEQQPQPQAVTPAPEEADADSSSRPLTCVLGDSEVPDVHDQGLIWLLGGRVQQRDVDASLIDPCFRRVEVYSLGSKGAIEDEFESFCRQFVASARQQCGDGGGLVNVLKPLLTDLMKRRQRLSSLANVIRDSGLDQTEKLLLRRHLMPRDLLIALMLSVDPSSQAKMLNLAAKTESVLPLLFTWGQDSSSDNRHLSLVPALSWPGLSELFCSPTCPLILNVGTKDTLGKSFLLQYLFALQEVHLRSAAKPPLQVHALPSVDLLGDFSREEPLRGVTLADVHSLGPGLCMPLLSALAESSTIILLHCSREELVAGTNNEPSNGLQNMLRALAAGLVSCTDKPAHKVIILVRDLDLDDCSMAEDLQMLIDHAYNAVQHALGAEAIFGLWAVPRLEGRLGSDLTGEMKRLRRSTALKGGTREASNQPTRLEDVLARAVNGRKFPALRSLRDAFERHLQADGSPRKAQAAARTALGQRVAIEFTRASTESLQKTLFPLTYANQRLSVLSAEKVHVLNKTKEYLEPLERQRQQDKLERLDKEMLELQQHRCRAPPHALLCAFVRLVLAGDFTQVIEFGAHLQDWKQEKRRPLLAKKLSLRRSLDEGKDSGQVNPEATKIREELQRLQEKLDEFDVSIDGFWLELMLAVEIERLGARPGILSQIHSQLTSSLLRQKYVAWVQLGSPIHFLHSSPLQFGAFDPMRWHPQLSGGSLFGADFIGEALRDLDRDLGVDARRKPIVVISVIGVQSSGKSTLMNYLFGCSFATHAGRCTKGLYISLLETRTRLLILLDTEGLLSVEARDDVFDKQVALMTMAASHLVIVNNRGELGRHVSDLFQVCLFALHHLKLARISPVIGFVLQCLSMVNEQQQYEWVTTVKKSLEDSVQELQEQEKGTDGFKLQDLVHLDSDSIFIMPSAFNDDVQFGLQVSRPTNLYALKAMLLRQTVFRWVDKTNAASAEGAFQSLSQWYEHARTVWQTLSMCGNDLLQFRTMRQVLMAQQLQEFCDSLVQKYGDGRMAAEADALIEQYTVELRQTLDEAGVKAVDNSLRAALDTLRDGILGEMQHEFDDFVSTHDTKFTDEQLKVDKRFGLNGPIRRKYASFESMWRSAVQIATEQRSMDTLFAEISRRVHELLVEQGEAINMQNVERVFEEKWNIVMDEICRKQKPNIDKVIQEVLWHYNAALQGLKSQFRKAHIFHSVKSLSVTDFRGEISSFLNQKRGIGEHLMQRVTLGGKFSLNFAKAAQGAIDQVWMKLVDAMRLELNRKNRSLTDQSALKILHTLNTELDSGDLIREVQSALGSSLPQNLCLEIARATVHHRFLVEQQSFERRLSEVQEKKQQKLWEIQAAIDDGKREVHMAKVWVKKVFDNLKAEFNQSIQRVAREITAKIQNIMTNPAKACELAIERSFTQRKWRHVVMYCIDPTQYLFREYSSEWERFQHGLKDQHCQELKGNFTDCLGLIERKLSELPSRIQGDISVNDLSDALRKQCEAIQDDALRQMVCVCLPSFGQDLNWKLKDLSQFTQFGILELRKYRAGSESHNASLEQRVDAELGQQKADIWKSIRGCSARCPGCGTKCNVENENHWPERPHECRRHLYPAFNGWQKQEDRKPFLLHCRCPQQWQIARTRPPTEPGRPNRFWPNFEAMLRDEHPDWLDATTRQPLASMEPTPEYGEDAEDASEEVCREIEENRRAWSNCKDALLQHFTTMADDPDVPWLDRLKGDSALTGSDFPSIRDELFESVISDGLCGECS